MSADPELQASVSQTVQAPMPRRPLWRRFFGLPVTRLGWWSVGLACTFFVFILLFFALVSAGQRGGATFFSNPWLAFSLLAAAGSALAGGVTAVLAIFRRGERTIFLFATLLLGLFVLLFTLGELSGGH